MASQQLLAPAMHRAVLCFVATALYSGMSGRVHPQKGLVHFKARCSGDMQSAHQRECQCSLCLNIVLLSVAHWRQLARQTPHMHMHMQANKTSCLDQKTCLAASGTQEACNKNPLRGWAARWVCQWGKGSMAPWCRRTCKPCAGTAADIKGR